MAKIEKYIIDKILEVARIEDVVADIIGHYSRQNPTGLKKKGVRYTALCPFHDDHRDGNFIVYPRKNCYRCFACDAKGGAVDFLMNYENLSYPDAIRWLGKKYNIPVDDTPVDWTPPPPRPAPPPLPPLLIPRSYVKWTMEIGGDNTLFIYWLKHLPWDNDQRARLAEVLWMYCVGGWRDGRVVFWMIDHEGNPRAAKLMRYLPDGHRDKEAHPGWIYNQDGVRQRLDPDNHEILKPLFGSHLLSRYPQAVVNIVESEKTALIMATAYGNHLQQVWMACGGVENLNTEKLKPIIEQHRRIILYPDRDGIDRWRAKQANLHYDRMALNVQAVTKWWKPCDGDKADIADVIVRMICEHSMPPKATLKQLAGENPALQQMVDKLKLEEEQY